MSPGADTGDQQRWRRWTDSADESSPVIGGSLFTWQTSQLEKVLIKPTNQVYRAAHDSPHHSSHSPRQRGLHPAHPAVGVDVTRWLDDGVGAEPDSIHKKLIIKRRDQSLLEAEQPVHFPDGVKSVEHIAVVHTVGAPTLQLSLQLHPSFDDLQRVGEEAGSARRHPAQNEVHRDSSSSGDLSWQTGRAGHRHLGL